MKIKNQGAYQEGLNPVISDSIQKGAEMDFSVLKISAGKTEQFQFPGETIYLLIQGKVEFFWRDEHKTADRPSCFRNNPVVLQVPQNEPVTITGISKGSEVAVMTAPNPLSFEPVFLTSEMCESVQRGEGTLRETATRIVRNIVNLDRADYSKFFMGEVINFPGKWSSYPPHQHDQPELYYYKFLPENGYGFSEDGEEAFRVENNDAGLYLNRSRHSQSAAPGYAMYYIWVIHHTEGNPHTGPDNAEKYMWTMSPDAKIFPEE